MSGTLGDLGQLGDGSMQMGFGGGASDPYMMELMRRRAMADALAKQGMAEAQRPMTHWLQPLGSIVQQGVAAWRQGKADDELLNYAKGQAVADQEARRNIMAMLLGGGQGAAPTPAPQPQPVAPSQGAAPAGGAQAPAPAMPANYGPTQAKAAFEYFTGQGFTPQQSAAMVANIKHESNFNPTLTHDGGIGYGVLGWNGPRLAAMRAKYGDAPTFQQQLEFMRDEVRNGTDQGMGKWGAIKSDDAGALGADLSSIGVRPRDVEGNRAARAATAQQYYQQFTGAQPNVNVSTATTSPTPSAPPIAAPTAAGGPFVLDKNRMLAAALAAGLSGRPGVAPLGTMLAGVARAIPDTNLQTANVGGNVVAFDPRTGNIVRTLGPNMQAGHALDAPDVENQQMRYRQAGATNVAMNNDKSYGGHLAEGLAKQDLAAIDTARGAADQIDTSRRIRKLLDENPIVGPGQQLWMTLAKGLNVAGANNEQTIATTQSLVSELARVTQEQIKSSGMGGGNGFSNADRDFLEKARAGTVEYTPTTLRYLADLNERAARFGLSRGNAALARIRKNPNTAPLVEGLPDFTDQLPNTSGQGAAAPATAAPTAPVKVATPEEAAKLPPGTRIQLPDGSFGVVPGR